MPSRDELLAELRRRTNPEVAERYMPSAQMDQMPEMQNASPEESSFKKFINKVDTVNKAFESTGIPAAGGGFLQGLGNSAISLANLIPLLSGSDKRIPHLDLKQFMQDPSFAQKAGFMGGDIAGNLATGAGVYSKLGALGRPSGMAGIGSDILRGGAAGFALGEDEEGNRGLSTAIGAALGPIGSSTKGATANRIKNDMNAAKKEYAGLYKNLFQEAQKEGLDKFVKVPKIPNKKLFNKIDDKFTEAFRKAQQSPTLDNVHAAQSKLGKFIAEKNKIVRQGGSVNDEAVNLARKLEEALENNLDKALSNSSRGLGKEYQAIQQGYKKDVIPYTKNAAINEFNFGESEAADLLKSLGGSNKSGKSFRKNLGSKYPEIKLKKGIDIASKVGLGVGGVAGLGKLGVDQFRDYFLNHGSHGGDE